MIALMANRFFYLDTVLNHYFTRVTRLQIHEKSLAQRCKTGVKKMPVHKTLEHIRTYHSTTGNPPKSVLRISL